MADKMVRRSVSRQELTSAMVTNEVIEVCEPDEDHGWDAATGFRTRKEGGGER